MSRHRLCLVLAAATSLGGCAALSEYDGMDDLVPKLFKQIKCEIYKSKQKDGPNPKSILSTGRWEIFGDLGVVADVGSGVQSSPKFTDSFASGSVTWGATPSINVEKKKSFKYYFTMDSSTIDASDCSSDPGNPYTLRGDLGIVDAARMAGAIRDMSNGSTVPDFKEGQESSHGGLFTHQVEFTITKSIASAGPTWVINRFSGLGATFSANRTDTNSLDIVFKAYKEPAAKAATKGGKAGGSAKRGVSPTISDNNLNFLLQMQNQKILSPR